MNDLGGKHRRNGDEDEDEKPVVGAPALRHRHDRQPGDRRLHRHALSDQVLCDGRDRVDDEAWQDTGKKAEDEKSRHGGEREAVGFMRVRGGGRARPAEKRDAVGANEACCRKRGAERHHRADCRNQQLQAPLRQLRAQQHGLEDQPLGGKSVERRQGGDGDAAAEEDESRPRHPVDQAAELFDVARARGGQHSSGAEEQQALEEGVIENVKKRSGECERRSARHAIGLEGERQAQPDEDDADVLDRAVGEQPFQVALHDGIKHAEHGGGAAEHQHHAAPPPDGRPEQIEDDADEAIDRHFGHHAAHQRRDMARGRRVRQRQPDVQRHETGFGTRSEQREPEDEAGEPNGLLRAAHLGECVAAGRPCKQSEGQQQSERAEARHHDVDVARTPVVGVLVIGHDKRPRAERHEFPGEEEAEGVGRKNDGAHAGEEGGIEGKDTPGVSSCSPYPSA